MSLEAKLASVSTSSSVEPHLRRWTREEYYRLIELGFFAGQRIERLSWMIVQQFSDREPELRKWTRDEYWRMADLGFFDGQKVERIDGEIIQHMSPQGAMHAAVILKATAVFTRVFPPGDWVVRPQMPLALGQVSDPEPDVAVVRGAPDDYDQHPTTADLVLEASGASLSFDTGDKANLYAAGGIADYWVVNCHARRLEVYRDPIADPTAQHGFRYQTRLELQAGDRAAPLSAPDSFIDPAELLPRVT